MKILFLILGIFAFTQQASGSNQCSKFFLAKGFRVHGPVNISTLNPTAKILGLNNNFESYGEARLNSPKVAAFYSRFTWHLETEEYTPHKPALTVTSDIADYIGFEKRSSLQITIVDKAPPEAGLGLREKAPNRVKKEIGTVKSGKYKNRLQVTITRHHNVRLKVEFSSLNRTEAIEILNSVDESYLALNNLSRTEVIKRDPQDSFFRSKEFYSRVVDKDGNLLYENPSRALFDPSKLPDLGEGYRILITTRGIRVMDFVGIFASETGREIGTFLVNENTNRVKLQEFVANLLD